MLKEPTGTLLVVLLIAFCAPLATSLAPWIRLPALVIEILLGVVIGPDVLDLVTVTEPIALLAELGIATLIFLAGFEIDPQRLRGRPLRLAASGWVISLVVGISAAGVLHLAGVVKSEMYVGLALTTTALGALLPILRDAGVLATPLGVHVMAAGSVGEFGPIIAVAVVLGGTGPVRSLVALALFAVVAVVALALASRPAPPRFHQALSGSLRSSGQLYVRLVMLLIAGLTVAAAELSLDVLLGAFTAGVIFRTLTMSGADDEEKEQIETKIEAISLGFLIPIFFVVTGIRFDLDALTGSASAMAKVPLFLALFLLARGLPVLLYRRELPERNDRIALGLFSATGLPLIVIITTLGLESGQMRSSTAAALVGAGMLSIIVFPLVGKGLLSTRTTVDPDHQVSGAVDAS